MADEAPKPESTEATDQPAAAPTGKPTMAVKVYAPFKVYFEGQAYSLSALNATGPFDVLPHHHNFLCMLEPCDVIVKAPNGDKKIKVHRALMHVKSDQVVVFMDV